MLGDTSCLFSLQRRRGQHRTVSIPLQLIVPSCRQMFVCHNIQPGAAPFLLFLCLLQNFYIFLYNHITCITGERKVDKNTYVCFQGRRLLVVKFIMFSILGHTTERNICILHYLHARIVYSTVHYSNTFTFYITKITMYIVSLTLPKFYIIQLLICGTLLIYPNILSFTKVTSLI
jgi:hypothetical protein